MSGLEILGVVASALQVLAYGISIASSIAAIYERVKNAPQQYHEYAYQITLLINTARSIEQNPVLQQIEDVHCYLTATLVEAKALKSILDRATIGFAKNSVKTKYWSVIKGSQQRKIFQHFENLQQKKTALLLCISTAHTTQLSNVQGSVDQLLDMTAMHYQRSSLEIEEKFTHIQTTKVNSLRETVELPLDIASTAQISAQERKDIVLADRRAEVFASRSADPMPGHTFGLIIIGGQSTVSNGNLITNLTNEQGVNRPGITQPIGNRHEYKNIIIDDHANVHNGNTGGTSVGHDFQRIEVRGCATVRNGDL